MDRLSENTLRKIEQNDDALKKLWIGRNCVRKKFDGAFNSSESQDFSRLGAAIGNNTHLTSLVIDDDVDNESALTVTNSEFFDGLKRQNTSIHKLYLGCQNVSGGVFHEILKVYQDNNNHLTLLSIVGASLQNGGDDIIANTLRRCTNLKEIYLASNITDAQLLPIVDAIRGEHHQALEFFNLSANNIGDAGCEALATLLADPSCNLQILDLSCNQIGDGEQTAETLPS